MVKYTDPEFFNYEDLPAEEIIRRESIRRQVEALEATGLTGVKDRETLKSRLNLFISWSCKEGYPCKLSTLNQRFGVPAHKYGTKVRELINELVIDGEIHTFQFGRNSIGVLSSEFFETANSAEGGISYENLAKIAR